MFLSKKHFLKLGLLSLLILSGVLCLSTVWNYGGNTQSIQNAVSAQGSNFNRKQIADQNTIQDNSSHNQKLNPNTGTKEKPNANQGMAPSKGAMPNRVIGSNSSSGNNYTFQIVSFAVAFIMIFLGAYYLIVKKKVKIQLGNEKFLILTLLGVGLFLRISLAAVINGHPFDLNLFKNWATTAADNLSQVYQGRNASDYPPLYIYVLFLIGKIESLPLLSPYFTLLLKLPSIIADIATAFLLYRLAKKRFSLEISLLIGTFYTFNPAIWLNSTVWGQVDSFFSLLVVLAVALLSEKKIGLASILFTSAVLMKPQGIIFLPVLFFELVRRKSVQSWIKVVGASLLTALVIVLPFSLHTQGLWIFKLFASTLGEYPYASVNAFNFFSLLGKNYASDTGLLLGVSYHSWGMLAIVLITSTAWLLYIKGKSKDYAAAAALLLIVGVFTFSTRMHERYLFPAVAMSILAFIYLRDKRLMLITAGFSTTVYVNTHFVLIETLSGKNSLAYNPIMIITSLLNVLLFVYLLKVLYEIVRGRSDAARIA